MIERTLDDRDGIIFVKATGIWTRLEVDQHYCELRRIIDRYRSAGQPVRVLSDVTQAQRQSPEMESYIRTLMDSTYRPGDRIALLVKDADDKAHVRDVLSCADVATFSSKLPAEMWLVTADLKRPA